MNRFLLYFTLCLILFASCNKDDITNDTSTHRTIIVYMAADNDLSDDAWVNINDMQRSFEYKGVNLVVFLDTADEAPYVLDIKRGGSTTVRTYPEFNSADATQMEQVLRDIINMYTTDSYGLILWSHGSSWLPAGRQLKSFGDDNGRQMDIAALVAALPVSFDFIIFDACLMGSVEVAYQLRHKTDFVIASSTEIIYLGFPYDLIVPELIKQNPNLQNVAKIYFEYYDRMQGAYRSASISLINTKEMESLAMATSQFLEGAVFDASSFDRSSVQRLDVYSEQYAFDFLDFLEKAFPDADIVPLKEQLDKTVQYKAHTPRFINEYNISTFCGLSCYIPHPLRNDLNAFYQQMEWTQVSGFYRLL